MLYTQHPLILERWPDEFSACQVIVINDLLKDFDQNRTKRLPTPEDIRSSFADEDPRHRLITKLEAALAGNQPVVCDIEFIEFSTAGADAWRNSVVNFFQAMRHHPRYNGLKLVMWGMPYAFDWMFTHEDRIRKGDPRSIAKREQVEQYRQEYSAFMREANSGAGNGRIGIGDLAHVNAVVLYQSLHHIHKWPDQPDRWHQPSEWAPALIDAAQRNNRPVAAYLWPMAQTRTSGEFVAAEHSHTLESCQVCEDKDIDEAYMWWRSADNLDGPDVIRNIETILSYFGNASGRLRYTPEDS